MVEPIERIHRPLKHMLWQNFLGGIAWALGVTIGLTVVVALLGFFLAQLDFLPIIGDFASDLGRLFEKNGSTPSR